MRTEKAGDSPRLKRQLGLGDAVTLGMGSMIGAGIFLLPISLAPLGRLIGDPDFGPLSQALIAVWEGGIFGFGVGIALLRRR